MTATVFGNLIQNAFYYCCFSCSNKPFAYFYISKKKKITKHCFESVILPSTTLIQ